MPKPLCHRPDAMATHELQRIDAHQHFWSVARTDYGWLTPDLPALYRDFQPADLQPMLAAHHVTATVLVQAAPSVDETRYMLGLASEHAFIRGVVGWVDLAAADAPAVIDELAEHPAFKGVRPMLQDLPDDAWIADAPIGPAIRHLVERGLSFDALVMPRHLPHLLRFAQRHPQLSIVIDHAAKPNIAARDFDTWRRDLAALAQLPGMHVKLSGLATEAGPGWTIDTLRPVVDTVLELFGPHATMWGSDWPVLNLAGDYAKWVRTSDELLAGLSSTERRAVFSGTARAFYRLPR
jgi:L-fuconolactonase